jgi:DNA topoisomerase-1
VQHGKVYANIGKDDDVLTIGGNRAIDLIVAKESGAGRFGRAAAQAGRVIGEHPEGGPVTVHDGKYGPYVKHGSVNATLPKTVPAEAVTLEQALELIAARAAAAPPKKGARKPAAKSGAKAPAKSKAAGATTATKAPAKAKAKAPAKAKSAAKTSPSAAKRKAAG